MSAKRNLLIGVGIGAVLGLLYAPHKGSKTRRLIAKRGEELCDGWDNVKETVSTLFEKNEAIEEDPFYETSAPDSYVNSPLREQWDA
jgi:gas vesicle protein